MKGESEGSHAVREWLDGREVDEAFSHRKSDPVRLRGRPLRLHNFGSICENPAKTAGFFAFEIQKKQLVNCAISPMCFIIDFVAISCALPGI